MDKIVQERIQETIDSHVARIGKTAVYGAIDAGAKACTVRCNTPPADMMGKERACFFDTDSLDEIDRYRCFNCETNPVDIQKSLVSVKDFVDGKL